MDHNFFQAVRYLHGLRIPQSSLSNRIHARVEGLKRKNFKEEGKTFSSPHELGVEEHDVDLISPSITSRIRLSKEGHDIVSAVELTQAKYLDSDYSLTIHLRPEIATRRLLTQFAAELESNKYTIIPIGNAKTLFLQVNKNKKTVATLPLSALKQFHVYDEKEVKPLTSILFELARRKSRDK